MPALVQAPRRVGARHAESVRHIVAWGDHLQGSIIQINVSKGGVPKRAIPSGVITPLGLLGDVQAHPNIHGGIRKAILLIAAETVETLSVRGYPIFFGALGENLTI